MYEMQGPRVAASRAAADCSAASTPSYRYRLSEPRTDGRCRLLAPDPGLLPDRGSFVAVNEFLQPSEVFQDSF
jgi:hypothetical protein